MLEQEKLCAEIAIVCGVLSGVFRWAIVLSGDGIV